VGRPRKFDSDTVVDQAIETFRARGYGDTSPQILSDRLGIGKGSLYNAFGSKHELFLTSLERYADAALADLKTLIDSELPIRDRVRRMLLDVIDSDLGDPERCGCLVVNSATELGSRDHEARRVLGASFEATAAVLYGAFRAAQQAGEITADRDARALAGLVQSAMIGLRVLMKTTDDRTHLESIVDATVAAI
jgi:TetR/AcrR family transcriptional regulator, transcriptional repressor for nem operon